MWVQDLLLGFHYDGFHEGPDRVPNLVPFFQDAHCWQHIRISQVRHLIGGHQVDNTIAVVLICILIHWRCNCRRRPRPKLRGTRIARGPANKKNVSMYDKKKQVYLHFYNSGDIVHLVRPCWRRTAVPVAQHLYRQAERHPVTTNIIVVKPLNKQNRTAGTYGRSPRDLYTGCFV